MSQSSVTDMNVRSRSRITSIAELIFFARDLALVQAKFIILHRARSLHDDSEPILLVGIELGFFWVFLVFLSALTLRT